jgi:hypothetical protein
MGEGKAAKAKPGESVEEFAQRLGRPLGPIVLAAAKSIDKHVPHATQTVKWGWPCWVGNGLIVSLCVMKKHVNMQFFRGAHLEDPEGALEGTGKDLRHIKLRKAADARAAAAVAVLKTAAQADKGG